MSGHLAVIPARAVTDERLGSAALRVLLKLGTYTDAKGWCRVKQTTIADEMRVSRRAVGAQLAHLVGLGYVQVKRTGRSSLYRVILDVPDPDAEPVMATEVPSDGSLDVPSDGSPRGAIDITTFSNDVLQRKTHSSASADGGRLFASGSKPNESLPRADDLFEEFWRAYPKRRDKGHARKAWSRAARKEDPAVIIEAARLFAGDPNLPETQFVPLAATWLNGERWEDGPLPSRNGNGRRRFDESATLEPWQT